MSTVKELHDKAMLLLQEAIALRHNGDDYKAEKKYKDAFILESKAADLVSQKQNCEPTRSILYRSAASLAYQAGDFNNSLNLIGKCLSGNPTPKIKDEVRVLYENIYLKKYLEQKKIILTDEEFDFHLVGNFISDGLIFYKEFVDRIPSLMQIIKKTAQRMFGKPYTSKSDILVPALHTPVGCGSFSIAIRIAYNKQKQQDIFVNPTIIVDEILDCFSLVQTEKDDELFSRIKDESYFNHFVSNSKKIAPDGENITGVDFISKRREVNFSRISDSIPLIRQNLDENLDSNELEQVTISGILDFASSKPGKDEFAEVTDENGKAYKIRINEGLDEYVRSFYKSKVIIEGNFDGKSVIYMSSMKEVE